VPLLSAFAAACPACINIQTLYTLAAHTHTHFADVFHVILSTSRAPTDVLVLHTRCVYCEVGSQFLRAMEPRFSSLTGTDKAVTNIGMYFQCKTLIWFLQVSPFV